MLVRAVASARAHVFCLVPKGRYQIKQILPKVNQGVATWARSSLRWIKARTAPVCDASDREDHAMINLDDILDMASLTRDEIAALAAHEHLDAEPAAALAEYLMHLPKGPQAVQRMIAEDIRDALHADDLLRARQLYATLHRFVKDHPEAVRGAEG